MKNSNLTKAVILLFTIASLAITATLRAGADYDYSRGELMGNSGLIIWRAADFGTDLALCIYIDGKAITTLVRGEAYRAMVRPGHHLLTVTDTPSPYGKTRFTKRRLDLAPGQNYSLTAMWDVETILLEEGHQYHGLYH